LKTESWIAIYTYNMVFSAKLIELIRIYDLFFIRKTGEPGSQSSGGLTTAQRQELTGALAAGGYGHGKLTVAGEAWRRKHREAHPRLRRAVR
jgi:hypothetical protein